MYLGYNRDNNRYGILTADLWENEGLHCGESFWICIDGDYVHTRIEMNTDGQWYLFGTGLSGEDLEGITIYLQNPDERIYGYPLDVWNSLTEDEQIAIQDRCEYDLQHPEQAEWGIEEGY